MTKTEQEIKESLKAWILKKNPKLQSEDLNDETRLMESRIISSLHIMELILEIEKLKGSKFNIKSMKPGVFQSVNSIYQAFFVSSL
jgi:acyl carrier protein